MKIQRGPDAGCYNTMMLVPVLKSRIGIKVMTLACLNIQSPDKRGLQRKVNTVMDEAEDMSKKQLVQNQQYVRRIQTFAGLPNESRI